MGQDGRATQNARGPRRGVFVLDKDGVIRYQWVSEDPTKASNYDEVHTAVAAVSQGAGGGGRPSLGQGGDGDPDS
ncbi:MAG: hypothetical protein ACE5HK_04960, partial [Candidatus Methylomirabilales bacterium]